MTLLEAYTKDSFNIADYGNDYEGVKTIDGSAVDQDISITGNDKKNLIIGGAGNDTLIGGTSNDSLTGGDGADVFLYTLGDGIDRIRDYDFQHDTIKLLTGSVDNMETAGEDIVFTIGDGKIIVEKVTYAVIIDGSGNQVPYRSPTKS